MSSFIKIYGERNTNTNHLSRLVALNLDVQEIPGTVPPWVRSVQRFLPGHEIGRDLYFSMSYSTNLGWKHSCVRTERELARSGLPLKDIAFVTITKNPYSWLLSLHRRPYHQYYTNKPDFDEFLRTPWKTVRRDNTPSMLDSPIDLWNIKNGSYSRLASLGALHLTTEGIIADPERTIDLIAATFKIRRRSTRFVDHVTSTKDTDKDSDYYRDFYLNERWRNDLTSTSTSIINERIDRQLMADFGYRLIP